MKFNSSIIARTFNAKDKRVSFTNLTLDLTWFNSTYRCKKRKKIQKNYLNFNICSKYLFVLNFNKKHSSQSFLGMLKTVDQSTILQNELQ